MNTVVTATPPPQAHGGELPGVGPFTSSRIFIGRSMIHSLRDGEGLVMAVALPTMLMLLFTLVFGGAITGDGSDIGHSYTDYVVPGIILICAGFGAASVAVSVSRDLTGGAMRRFRAMPIAASTVLAGHIVASVIRNLVATAVVIGVALAIGFRPSAGPLEWVVAFGLVTLWILAITVVFAFVGLVAGSQEAANGYGFGLLFLPYVSSAFVPTDTMPSWLAPVADAQPVSPLTDSIRAAFIGGHGRSLEAVIWCVAIIVVAAGLIAWRFPRNRDR